MGCDVEERGSFDLRAPSIGHGELHETQDCREVLEAPHLYDPARRESEFTGSMESVCGPRRMERVRCGVGLDG